MTAAVVSLADWRAARARRAHNAAVAANHPCAGAPLLRGRQLVVIGTGTVAHAVEHVLDVPYIAAGSVTPSTPPRDVQPHTAVLTYCGRSVDAEDCEPRTGDSPRPCRRCTNRLLRLLREGY